MNKSLQFMAEAFRTMPRGMTREDAETMLSLGLAGEVGELLDLVKKMRFHGATGLEGKMQEEAGDVLWYAFNLLDLRSPFGKLRTARPVIDPVDALAGLGRFYEAYLLAATRELGGGELSPTLMVQIMYMEAAAFRSSSPSFVVYVLSRFCEAMKLGSLDEIMDQNMAKLRKRYPHGFIPEASMARADEER